jgi:hypothetical protein
MRHIKPLGAGDLRIIMCVHAYRYGFLLHEMFSKRWVPARKYVNVFEKYQSPGLHSRGL